MQLDPQRSPGLVVKGCIEQGTSICCTDSFVRAFSRSFVHASMLPDSV